MSSGFLLFASLLISLCLPPLSSTQPEGPLPQPFSAPGACMDTPEVREFFRSGDLMCAVCPANQVVEESGLSCRCELGYYRLASSERITDMSCQQCGSNNMVTTSEDGLFCLSCSSGTVFDISTKQCTKCSLRTEILVDTLPSSQSEVGTRSCVPCPLGTWADDTEFQCVECGVADCSQCVQNIGTIVSGGVCFSFSSQPLPSPPPTTFPYYSQHFTAAAEQCRATSNATACQLVANLCVLQTYLRSDPACSQSLDLVGPYLPPIFYPERGAVRTLEETSLGTKLSTKGDVDATTSLPLVLASFSLNGTFLGLEETLTGQIFLCLDRPSRSRAAWRVGVHYQIRCVLSISELTAQANSPVFYDLFLRDVQTQSGSGSTTTQLVPIPILVTNYLTEGAEPVNERGVVDRWQLVRRFFLAEGVSEDPQYIERMELIVELTSDGGIQLPYLRITYASWTPNADSAQTIPSSYRITYIRTSVSLVIGLAVTALLLGIAVMVYVFIKTNGFLRRSGGLLCELPTLIYLIVELCGTFSSTIFILLTITSVFYLILFKAQSVFFFPLPTEEQDLVFKILLGVALVLRLIYFIYMMWYQCSVDIFFMDWERPRGLILSSNLTSESNRTMPTTVATPVSIWRTYFVANEWNEIQSLRKINHTLMLVLTLLFVEVVGLGNLAERDPITFIQVSSDRYSAPFSDILRFSISSLHFIVIAVLMRVYVYLIHERYVEHKLHQFVDLCSVSNISVFLMPHNRFGHYIHGNSVHGHTDTNMKEMDKNLLKERDGMCGSRGLENDSSLQTYELALTLQFRTRFEKILGPLRAERAEGRGGGARAGREVGEAPSQQRSEGISETTMRAYNDMNHFLTSFCDRSIQGLDYSIKNKLLPERVLGMEFHDTETNSILYRDPGYSFDSVLFYGHCWTLFQIDVLLFAVVDLIANDYVLSAVITFIFSLVVNFIRDALGRRNLARKTLTPATDPSSGP